MCLRAMNNDTDHIPLVMVEKKSYGVDGYNCSIAEEKESTLGGIAE